MNRREAIKKTLMVSAAVATVGFVTKPLFAVGDRVIWNTFKNGYYGGKRFYGTVIGSFDAGREGTGVKVILDRGQFMGGNLWLGNKIKTTEMKYLRAREDHLILGGEPQEYKIESFYDYFGVDMAFTEEYVVVLPTSPRASKWALEHPTFTVIATKNTQHCEISKKVTITHLDMLNYGVKSGAPVSPGASYDRYVKKRLLEEKFDVRFPVISLPTIAAKIEYIQLKRKK